MNNRCPVCRNEGRNRTCHPIEDEVSRLNLPDTDPRAAPPSDPAAPPEQCCWFRLGHSGPHEHAPSDPAAPLRAALRLRWDSIRPDEEPTMLDTDVAVFYLRIGDVRAALTPATEEAECICPEEVARLAGHYVHCPRSPHYEKHKADR